MWIEKRIKPNCGRKKKEKMRMNLDDGDEDEDWRGE